MKKLLIITGCVTLAAVVVSCKDKRSPGRAYAPDMTYSVAYETYARKNQGPRIITAP